MNTRRWVRFVWREWLLPLAALLSVPFAALPAEPATDRIGFEQKIEPLLQARCVACHGGKKREAELDLRSVAGMLKGGKSGPALVPGKAAGSLLWQRIRDGEMPPKKPDRLSADDVALVGKWIDGGARAAAASAAANVGPSTDHWLFKKLVRPPLPGAEVHKPNVANVTARSPDDAAVAVPASGQHPIDAFVDAKLRDKRLTAAPPADRRTLIRRAYFDLLGLPPSPQRVEAFLADPSPGAWENLIGELLASPQYGERWGRHWLDVARYADTGGYETDIYYKNAWRYRDYVVKSLNDDKPYDRFVQEQIAGDELWPDNLDLDGSYVMSPEKLAHLEAHVATGFYALGPQIHESNMQAKKLSLERLTDWVDTTGAAFLGLSLACARCHDHKFDPLTQRDYYGLQAVFAASREVEMPLVNGMEIADYKQHYPRLLAVDEARRAYRLFEQSVAGRNPTAEEQQKRGQLRDALADALLAVPERATSSPNSPFVGLMEIPTATVLGPERAALIPPIHLLSRGDLSRPKEQASPQLPAVLARSTDVPPALPGPLDSRKQLALWLTRPDHPLTARVLVNRVWQWHFGRGIVSTPNDFGRMGSAPSNLGLLDWLASEFVSRDWSIKSLHRLIMTSQAYQRSSMLDNANNVRIDPDNRFIWRANRRRLEAEALWDSIHSVAGTLNLKMGGRPVMPPLAAEELTNKSEWIVSADPGEHTRRGIYILVRRNFRFPLFDVFDAPVNAVSCAAREVSTVAPQALWLLNNRTAYGQSQQFAARLVREAGPQPEAWIERAWRLALGRGASPEELREALDLLAQLEQASAAAPPPNNLPKELAALGSARASALTKLCLTVLNMNEFVYVD